jgi:hypothetical protein
MLMPHLYSGHEGVMRCDGCEGALEFGKKKSHAWQVVMRFEASFVIEGQ